MQSKTSSASSHKPSPARKPPISADSEMLTPSEIERLRQESRETQQYARKVFREEK